MRPTFPPTPPGSTEIRPADNGVRPLKKWLEQTPEFAPCRADPERSASVSQGEVLKPKRPLLKEELSEKALQGPGFNIADTTANSEQQQRKRTKLSSARDPPPSPYSASWPHHEIPQATGPPSILPSEHPAFSGVRWDQHLDDFNDSGYSGSSSFGASTYCGEDYNILNDEDNTKINIVSNEFKKPQVPSAAPRQSGWTAADDTLLMELLGQGMNWANRRSSQVPYVTYLEDPAIELSALGSNVVSNTSPNQDQEFHRGTDCPVNEFSELKYSQNQHGVQEKDNHSNRARAWAGYALASHSSGDIERKLSMHLKSFTEDLSARASDEIACEELSSKVTDDGTSERAHECVTQGKSHQLLEGATKLIRRYRLTIARYFCDNAVSDPVTESSLTLRLQALSKHLSLTEKLGLLDKVAQDPAESGKDILTDDEVDELFVSMEGIKNLLVSSASFEHLAADLRRALYRGNDQVSDSSVLASRVRHGLFALQGRVSSQTGTIALQVKWSLPSFLRLQYGEGVPQLGSVVTLSGTALYAQATTCLEYARTIWPLSGSYFVSTMDAMFRISEEGHADYNGLYWNYDSRGASPKNDQVVSHMFVYAKGPIQMLVDLAQQLAWIGSAFSSSPYDEQLAYCKPALEIKPSTSKLVPTYELNFHHRSLHRTENACWLPMFCGASIAQGFPIPERGDETGLEVPLDLMSGIVGAQHAVEYDGGIVMKGFSTILVPTKRADDRVQWHLISSGDADTRLSYQDGLKQCKNRLSTDELSFADLSMCRAIVGWCTSATSLLGSGSANYENIDYSGAEEADSPLKFAGGTIGIQQIGVAQLDFKLGAKDGKSHFQRNVMLHIAQHRHWLEPFEINGKKIDLVAPDTDSLSAKDKLRKNASKNLSDYEKYTFKDLILNIWSLLEFLIDQNVLRERSTPGASVKGTLRENISGFEFKAVVEERSPFRQKQVVVRKTCGGWPMLARDIDALVLFANGFEDLIRPRKDDTKVLCNLWRSVPKWKDYLASGISTIKDLYDVAGSRLDRQYLTSTRLQWDRGSSVVFEACRSPDAYRCRCNRLQQIVPKSAIGAIVPPGQLFDDGAVIFGHSGSMIRNIVQTAPRIHTTTGLFSQPNVSLAPVINHPNPYDSASDTSEDEPTARGGSDTTVDSFPSSITSITSREGVTPAFDDLKINQPVSYVRKRLHELNEGVGLLGGVRCRETSPKRLKHHQYVDVDVDVDEGDLSDEDREFAMRPVIETAQRLRRVPAMK
ncbi:hypothetical protein BDV95DRAFT_663285 [Massariosphaeria phaeospora]|uniref:Pfs domain protein n=1 Tax=Massariosphaeria phaeospora TaxID=100035 RepID=A0A7C8MJW2_9PLEO|nr:hypothetical protein BDV95DRAFT_663285 [Massariosphaeria phaeospora]